MRGEAPKMRTGRGFQLLVISLLSVIVIAGVYDGLLAHASGGSRVVSPYAPKRSFMSYHVRT